MGEKKTRFLFNLIAPVYALFFNSQKKNYSRIIETVQEEIDLTSYNTVLDVGCGTGALSAAFAEKGMKVTASYVAHGMDEDKRKKMYAEMSRIAKQRVIIHDYNKKRSFLTSFIEWLEGGDYFNFIKNPKSEMEDCLSEMQSCFAEVKAVNVDDRADWYICKVGEEF